MVLCISADAISVYSIKLHLFKILLKSYNNFVISLASISALYSLLYRIEEDITALFIDLRNFMVLFLCGLIIYIANKVLKGSIKTYAHPSRYTNL